LIEHIIAVFGARLFALKRKIFYPLSAQVSPICLEYL